MEVAGLVIGIAGLYATCRDCYSFFTTVNAAEGEAATHLRELEIQQSILKAWGFHWQIQDEDGIEPEPSGHARPKRTRLHDFLLSNRFKADGVFKTLSALADTLSDQGKLAKRYGIQFRPAPQAIQDGSQSSDNVQLAILDAPMEDVKPVISEVKKRLSVLNKFKWALKDKDEFKELIAKLRSHSDSLYRLCPENAFESMNIYFIMECLAKQESPAGLKWTSRIATRHAEVDQISSVREGYELLASAATLKASVNENREKEQADDGTLTTIGENQPEMLYLGKGLALFGGQVVYVEMRDYRGPPLPLTPEQELRLKRIKRRLKRANRKREASSSGSDGSDSESSQDDEPIEIVRPADPNLRALIKNFFNTFQGPNMMKSVFGLDIAGMVDHTEGKYKGHCSILYKLPGTIGVQSRERPAGNLKLRAPVTLQLLLGNRNQKGVRDTLGARFELARNLVRAVCLLHTSGWLHKNIRAETVLFFPELQEDRYEVKIEIDVSKPTLMGYTFSRPDDIMIQLDPPSTSARAKPEKKEARFKLSDTPSVSTVWDNPGTGLSQREKPAHRDVTPRAGSIYGFMEPSTYFKATDKIRETTVSGFTLDYYQHPAKHADPTRQYRHAYDVYSLGILLLEVGLWQKLRDYDQARSGYSDYDAEDHYERRRWICREYLDRLRFECGDTYADVVLSCLMIDSSDDEVSKASERELCARIVADLEGCRA